MPNVTLFKDITDTTNPVIQSVDKVLGFIRDGRWKDKVEAVRNALPNQQDSLKIALPCILYAGEFTIKLTTDKGVETCRKGRC